MIEDIEAYDELMDSWRFGRDTIEHYAYALGETFAFFDCTDVLCELIFHHPKDFPNE